MHELVTIVAQYVIIVPVICYAVVFACKRKRPVELLAFTIVSVILATILAKIAGALHSDPRPFMRDGVTPYFSSNTDNGFPSDHTLYSAVIAFVVFRYYKWLGVVLAVTAVLVGTARVIGGVHHAQDVVAGMLIAAAAVYIANLLTKYFLKRRNNSARHE